MSEEYDDVKSIQIIKTPYDLQDKSLICYPQLILSVKIRIPRLFMQPRTVYSAVTVDLVKGDAARSNMFPEYEEIQIPGSAVITALTTTEAAIEEAKHLLFKWVRHKFKVYKPPEFEIVKLQEVYKVFFYADIGANEMELVDSVKGLEKK